MVEPATIVGISSMATRRVLAELCELRARLAAQRVDVVAVGGVDAVRRVEEGEPFDFVVLADDAVTKLARSGRLRADSRTPLARSSTAVAVAAGADAPDISSESAVRDAVSRARAIGYSTGPSGVELMRLFARWGIADDVTSRLVQAPAGVPVATLVAEGRATLGFQQLGELLDMPGVTVVGLLPREIEIVTIFSAAMCTRSARQDAVADWLAFLASPQTAPVKRRHGMEPA